MAVVKKPRTEKVTKIPNSTLLSKFIIDNKLTFWAGDRNSNTVTLCGYACFIGADDDEVVEAIRNTKDASRPDESEISRIWNFADQNNYQSFWNKPEAKTQYKF